MKDIYKVNRFPICSIVHYAIAKKFGYPEYQAKALAHATAVFYAFMKKKWSWNRLNFKKSPSKAPKNQVKPAGMIRFFDREFSSIKIGDKEYPVLGGKVITERDFDKALNSKFNEKEKKAIIDFAINYVSKIDEYMLRRPFEIYKRVRDEWRTLDFWNKLMKGEI